MKTSSTTAASLPRRLDTLPSGLPGYTRVSERAILVGEVWRDQSAELDISDDRRCLP
jgi:hypothetical protein